MILERGCEFYAYGVLKIMIRPDFRRNQSQLLATVSPCSSLSELECKPIIIGLIVGSGGSLRLVKSSGGADGRGGAGGGRMQIHRFPKPCADRGKRVVNF